MHTRNMFGIEAVIETKDCVAFINEKPYDWLHRMRLGMSIFDRNALKKGRIMHSKQRLRGPYFINFGHL